MNVLVISSHYNEDLTYMNDIKYPIHVYSHNNLFMPSNFGIIKQIKYNIIPNIGLDHSSYIKSIIDYYDNIPDKIFFIHGHEMSYHQSDKISNIINSCNLNQDFKNLSNISPYKLDPTANLFLGPKIDVEGYRKLKYAWKYIFEDMYGEIPEIIQFCVCPQFMVDKKLILSNPKEYYVKMYDFILNQNCVPDGWVPYIFEYMYYYMFTKNNIYCEN